MGTLARFKLSTRMQLLVGLTLVGLLVLCVTALFQLKGTMLEDRKEKVRNVVEVGIGIISHHHKLFTEGKLSEDDAKVAARNALRDLRYASNDYYFGFDTNGVYFVHGGNQAMEGQNKIDLKDTRSEEHTSELQSHHDLVCRLLLEKKKSERKKKKKKIFKKIERKIKRK